MTTSTPSKHVQRSQDTRKKILDSAETLFADKGINGVSLRKITVKAGVDLALVNYHFGSKQQLFDAVVLRRAQLLRDKREKELEACLTASGNATPTVESIIAAYINPLLDSELHGDPGWANYFTIIARLINSPEPSESSLGNFFDSINEKFFDALRLAMPGVNNNDIYWCCHFMSGVLSVTFSDTNRLDRVSEGQCQSSDVKSAAKRMIPFLASGFKAACFPAAESNK